jgi:DNA-binding transcriptional ArsR family regulator
MAARPTTRRAPGRPADTVNRPIVRDLSRGGAPFRIDWDVRPAYDFVFSLSSDAGATDDLPAADRLWLTDSLASLEAEDRSSIRQLFENELCIQVAAMLVDRPDVRTSADFVAAIEASSPAEVIAPAFLDGHHDAAVGDLVRQALGGQTDVLEELEERLPEWNRQGRMAVLRDPRHTYERITDGLRAWQARFAEIEPRVTAILERDYDGRAADRDALAPVDLIERTTGGIRWLPEPGVRRVILGPSDFSRPYNFLMAAGDWRFFGYPVGDEALDESDALTAPQSVVRLHRALGDSTRLKILKLLASRDLYLTEIAQQLDLSKPTIKHHLAQLRAAGLVTITESGTVMYYSLRRNRLDDASAEIKRFLIG